MDIIQSKLKLNYQIKWVGYHGPQTVWIHMTKQNQIEKIIVELKEDYTEASFRKIKASSAENPGSHTGTIWNSDSRLELLRLASILGLNVGGTCLPGAGQEYNGTTGCIMAYDIETDRSRLPHSSFPTLSESITSLATYCSCGEICVFSFIPGIKYDYTLCRHSTDVVGQFIEYIKKHAPQWLVGYNNFRFDNTVLAYHADMKYDSIFIRMKVGAGSSLSYAYYIDIEGVYNIDLLTYLDKTRRAAYPNMSLATLVEHHGIESKLDFSTSDVTDFARLLEYNVQDSKITMELTTKSGALSEITSLAIASCSPVIDCVRFVSGTLAACSIASYCLANKICMDWSPCLTVQEYRGAEVLKPIVGLHEDVVSCDFSSMYPTVLVGANISLENCTQRDMTKSNGAAWKEGSSIGFAVEGHDLIFDDSPDSIIPPVMKLFVERRKQVRKTKPAYALGLKIAANSIYGSLGDRHSRIYSPNCSASVTTGGRWCLAVAGMILSAYGFKVVYGDTDSCFVAKTEKNKAELSSVTKILSRIFRFTPFPGMSMEIENRYSKIAFLGKKTYFGKIEDGPIVSKGMSKSRKDRIGICRMFSSMLIPVILQSISIQMRQEIVADMICVVIDAIAQNRLVIKDMSKIVKRSGSNYYEYRAPGGSREFLECESTNELDTIGYSAMHVSKLLIREISMILGVTGTGSIASILRYANII